jgi:Cu-Zn family superoxide dismutase
MRLTALALSFGLIAAATTAHRRHRRAEGRRRQDPGDATLTEAPHGVLLRIEAKGLTPGWHGLHFHEKGDCGAPDFKSAGAHVHTTTAVVHGLLNPDGNDNGDLPNLFAAADGSARPNCSRPGVAERRGRPPRPARRRRLLDRHPRQPRRLQDPADRRRRRAGGVRGGEVGAILPSPFLGG